MCVEVVEIEDDDEEDAEGEFDLRSSEDEGGTLRV